MGSKRVGDESEGRLSDAGDEPDSEGDFTAAVPSALVAGSSSGRRPWRLSMALSPQAEMGGRKRATVAAPDPKGLPEPAARLTKYTTPATVFG
jgi:hypothetical protein